MNEARILGLIDECIASARYVDEAPQVPMVVDGFALSSNFNNAIPMLNREPFRDSIVLPASLWTQLVFALRPAELASEPEESS